ncbi:DUF402 domain-containing protein [Actinopolymorpha singaporensis]|uniref:DUF402 domain-containing protein n=1 Tax=Actinopolymorpha singaporensis TaxID=117157 RepID=A0A1H1LBX4_9ACTN|nr:DUF402 domain-containing protein [Actinopolymorpha singaporensis]SDR71993.1 Protein of unknown function [Actinopolymorpha singaporensis]
MTLQDTWRPGTPLIVEERWHGHLWSAVPHVVVEDGLWCVTHVPAGTTGAYASSVGVPGRECLPRSERKLLAMQTLVYEVVERPIGLCTLHFFSPGTWARVILGWTETGDFLGWYVNLELPLTRKPDGIQTMDLVLDVQVRPDGSWAWKDREDFDDAVRRGVLDGQLLGTLEDHAHAVLAQAKARTGPFEARWLEWQPDPTWERPTLPAAYRATGVAWSARRHG